MQLSVAALLHYSIILQDLRCVRRIFVSRVTFCISEASPSTHYVFGVQQAIIRANQKVRADLLVSEGNT